MKTRLCALAGLLVMTMVIGCGKKAGSAASAAEGVKSAWTCEEHWMVASVVADVQGMASLTAAATVPGKRPRAYQVGEVELELSPSCWDSASYLKLLEDWQPAAATAEGAPPELLHELLTPTSTVLQKANLAVSARLAGAVGDPRVHEEAAFLLGVLGIRENARQFEDLRPLICRMTAHLVLAEKLRGTGKISPLGEWARVFYDLHAGRPRKAMERMETIPVEGDAGRWKRAVTLLITGDWRRTEDLAEPSLVEAIGHARALKDHRGNALLMEFVQEREDLQAIPEWSRLLGHSRRSVDDGHLLMRSAIPMEFLEISGVFPIGENPDPAKLAKFLALESAGARPREGARVISDADWAAYFRRHFFASCADVSHFTVRQWASDEAAAGWEKSVLPYCRLLPGHPLVEPLVATEAGDFQSDLRATAEFIRKRPELAPTGLWFDYRFPNLKVPVDTRMPDQIPWFREVSPPGTAFDPKRRVRFEGIHGSEWLKANQELHAIDPWDSELCFEVAENTGNNLASVERAWGGIREYSVRPLRQTLLSPTLTAEERIKTLQVFTSLDPEIGLQLGSALVTAGRPQEAIGAYEIAYNDAEDRVAVANQSQWMIHHYKNAGQDAKAREVADHNAEVYSQSGLSSAMTLAIMEKDRPRAKGYAQAIAERYGESCHFAAAAWGDPEDPAVRAVFPDGVHEVTLADFPEDKRFPGIRIDDNSATVRAVGLRAGDVVLAVDGKRAENFQQYLTLLSVTLDPHTRLVYRRGKVTAEIECQLPQRRLETKTSDVTR